MRSPATPSSIAWATGWLRRFARDDARYVGIDVGIDQVKIATFGKNQAQAACSSDKRTFAWQMQSEFRLPVDPHAAPRPDWVDLVVEGLSDRLPRCVDGDSNIAVVALPIPWIHYQTIAESEMAAAQGQCDAMFGASIFHSSAHLAKWPIAIGKSHYVIAATAESAAGRIAESIATVGYRVHGILPHGVALMQAAPALTSLTPSIVLLLELSGGLVALRNEHGCGLCRTLPALSLATGEQPSLEEMEPWLQEIALEVNATSRYAARWSGELTRQSAVLICGRAAQVNGVDAALATMLGRPVAAWRYAGRCRPNCRSSAPGSRSSDPSAAVSLSLAYCGFQASDASRRRER